MIYRAVPTSMNSLDQTGAVSLRGAPRATKQPARTITQRPQIVSQALVILMTRHYLLVDLVNLVNLADVPEPR
jgi:hypothetical protein